MGRLINRLKKELVEKMLRKLPEEELSVAGRIFSRRHVGQALFLDI